MTEKNIVGYQTLLSQLEMARTMLNQSKPGKLLLVAGDCAAEIAPIEYLNNLYDGRVTVIWLDAHGDLNDPESSPSRYFHGMPLRLLLDGHFPATALSVTRMIDRGRLIMAGQRDLDAAEAEYIRKNSIVVFSNPTRWKDELLAMLAKRNPAHVYIHLDLDVIDPLIFPSVKCPAPDGLFAEDIAEFIGQTMARYDVVGLSLTETTAATLSELTPIDCILRVYREYLSKDDTSTSCNQD